MNTNTGDTGNRQSCIVPAGSITGPEQDVGVLKQKDDTLHKMSLAIPNFVELSANAKDAADSERRMGFREGVKLYPVAMFFSFGLSLAVVMEGYDTWLLGSFYAMPAFNQKFGQLSGHDPVTGSPTYQINVSWQNALTNCTYATQILGLFLNGIVSERIGYRYTMIGSLVISVLFIFLQFFAKNVEMLLAGYILLGLPWGVFQTLTTTYAAEVCPVALRAYLTTYVNLCWVMGQLIASGVLKGFLAGNNQWSYRVPYAIQWVWPIPIGLICYFAPESPWWLVRHNKLEQARRALSRLTSNKDSTSIENTLAMLIHTNELEIQQSSGTSYWDCFKGVDLRRTELTTMAWVIQQTSGSAMIGWGTYFMVQAGLDPANAFSLGVGQSAIACLGTIVSWFLMPHFGRRTIYLGGQTVMLLALLTIGGLGVPQFASATSWATGGLILLITFAFCTSVGPVCYPLVAELPSTRLRIKSVVISRNSYNICAIIIGTLQPRFMNTTSGWGWRGKTAFFWAGSNLLGLAWTYYRLPETKGLTYADIDVLFENKVPARQFSQVKVDPFRSANSAVAPNEYGSEKEVAFQHKEV